MKQHTKSFFVGSLLAACLCLIQPAHAGKIFGPVEFMGNVSMGTWTNPVTGIALSTATGGIYTNGVYTNFYRIFATNNLGRLPVSTNVSFSWSGTTNTSNAVIVIWSRYDGIDSYIVEKSYNAGSTYTNWIAIGANYTNMTDYGTNAWGIGSAETMFPAISSPTSAFASLSQGAKADTAVQPDNNNTFTDMNTFRDIESTNRLIVGKDLSIDNISVWSKGASQHGRNTSGTMTIDADSYGASQHGWNNTGIMRIGTTGQGAMQRLNNSGTADILETAYGACQFGYNDGTITIGKFSYGAMQFGRVQYMSCATNDGVGAIQLLAMTNSNERALTTTGGAGSLLLGAGTASNKYAVVAGDMEVSHGDGSITAGGGFFGDGSHLSGVLRYVSAPISSTASGSAGQVAWTNDNATNWFLYFDPNGLGPGTSAWVRIQGGASW